MSDTFVELMGEINQEVHEWLDRIGSGAEEVARNMGNYHNRTGNLRRSIYHKVNGTSLEFGASAPYASKVSSMGYDVIDSGVELIKKELE